MMATFTRAAFRVGCSVRFIMPLMVKLFGLAIVVLILAVKFGDSWGFTG